MLAATAFDIARFSINTDVEQLISENIPSRQRQLDLSKAFPEEGIIAVVKAPSAENTEQATNALARELSRQSDFFAPSSGIVANILGASRFGAVLVEALFTCFFAHKLHAPTLTMVNAFRTLLPYRNS
jgi:hypothetical protein